MSSIIKDFIEQKDINSYEQLIDALSSSSFSELRSIVVKCDELPITAANIPQYSNYDNATVNIISSLRKSGNFGPDFLEVGRHYLISNRSEWAYQKYGENHSKTAAELGLATIKKEDTQRVYLSRLGLLVEQKGLDIQKDLIFKLAIGIPIIQKFIKVNLQDKNQIIPIMLDYLSETTAKRRLNNCWCLYVPFLERD